MSDPPKRRYYRGPIASIALPMAALLSAVAAEPVPAEQGSTPEATTIVRAAAKADSERLKALVASGALVDVTDPRGRSALQVAAAGGLDRNVAILLAAGADLDAIRLRGITALGWAARRGHTNVVRVLLDAGAHVDAGVEPLRTALPLAVARSHRPVAALLIKHGSKFSVDPALGAATFVATGETESPGVADLVVPSLAGLVERSAIVRVAAAQAIADAYADVGSAILLHLGPVADNPEFQTALLTAAIRRNRMDVLESLSTPAADANTHQALLDRSLSLAVGLGRERAVRWLLGHGADPKAAGASTADLEGLGGDVFVIRHAAALSLRIGSLELRDGKGRTLLFRAAQHGSLAIVRYLLSNKANPAATVQRWHGDEGWTPLMIAAAGGFDPVVRALLDGGAPVDQRNDDGRTALLFAAFYGRAAVVATLLNAGADHTATDQLGQTADLLARSSGDAKTIEALHRVAQTGTSR